MPDGQGGSRLKPCNKLPAGTTLDSTSVYGEKYGTIQYRERQLQAKILAETEVKEFRVVYSCEFEGAMSNPESDVYAFFQNRQEVLGKKLPPPLKLRSCLKGSRGCGLKVGHE